ncbi:MAG: methyltransferase domain-containing protein [Geminicoccaceae bacterium]
MAEDLDPSQLFAHPSRFDHITISYCLSMVDDPEVAVRAATRHLSPGGTLHIVDFGSMAGLPGWARTALTAWLARFHVRYRPEMEAVLKDVAKSTGAGFERRTIGGDYAHLLRLRAGRG